MNNKYGGKVFLGADYHFSHKSILRFCPDSRPFKDVDEMNEAIVDRHNSMVSPEDTTYMLGDIAFCSATIAAGFLNRMNGKKILITGNHDKGNLKQNKFRDVFEEIHEYLEIRLPCNTKVCMFHFPIYSWNESHYGGIHFFGHLHSKPALGMKGRCMDVGLDTNNCYPYNMDDLVEKMKQIEFRNDYKDGV